MSTTQCISLLLFGLLSLFSTQGAVEYKNFEAEDHSNVLFHEFKRQARMNTTTFDHHEYYTSQYYPPGDEADRFWFDISDEPGRENVDLANAVLSENYRILLTHPLPFQFPFYGHIINTVGVTTAGFLYTSNFTHPVFIALTHHIAPLQADFNPSINDTARIFIDSTADRFTVQWDKVHNVDHLDDGPFTFQVSLFSNGSIYFAYREIPLPINQINNFNHPVEVGLADSFYVDRPFAGGAVFRSVFEYSRISLNATQQLNYSAYVITPLPNCVMASSCEECFNINRMSSFVCEWCPTTQRCSDGLDRFTQDWFDSGCSTTAVTSCEFSTMSTTIGTTTTTATITTLVTVSVSDAGLTAGAVAGISVGVVILLAVVILGLGVIAIFYIGYKRPNSRLGLFLIEHRPKARSLNKSSAKYNIESGKAELKEDLSS